MLCYRHRIRIRYSRMPCRNICITTVCLQFVSLVTFFSVWQQQPENVIEIKSSKTVTQTLERIYVPDKNPEIIPRFRNPLAEVCLPTHDFNNLCPKLFMGDTSDVDKLKKKTDVPPMCKLSTLLKDCTRFIQAHEYLSHEIRNEEKEFPLAFGIKMHKSPEQAERLLRAIYRPHNIYCIYVDGKSPPQVYETMRSISKCFDNVIVVEDRENVVYASSAHVRTDLVCMKKCKESKVKWKYYLNLSGQEYPLRTNLELVAILKSLNGANDVESYTHPVFLQWRLRKKYKMGIISLVETSENKTSFKYDIQMSKGSAYGSFSKEFVDFVLSDDVAQDLIVWLNDTYAPEENVWATLNTFPWTPGGYEMEIRHWYGTFVSRAMIWQDDKTNCRGRYIRGVCVFGARDLPWLASRPQLFANKFDEAYDQIPLDCLENLLRNRTLSPRVHTLDWYYYRTLPHVAYNTNLKETEKKESRRMEKKQKWMMEQKKKIKTKPQRTKGRVDVPFAGGSIKMFNVPASDNEGWISK